MVTASYCTGPMQALHQDAVDAGITVVNEVNKLPIIYNDKSPLCYFDVSLICYFIQKLCCQVGVDPGIDHLLAMECFDEVHTGIF